MNWIVGILIWIAGMAVSEQSPVAAFALGCAGMAIVWTNMRFQA